MPQPPLQPNATQLARLPLTKFSHTTTSINHGGPLNWSHINGRGSLMCVFDRFPGGPVQPPRLILRVTNNRGILEQLDLEHFVRAAAAQSRVPASTTVSKPLFAVVVMSPCLAVKYAQNETHVRRFQVKFSQDPDYYTALNILREINCPLTEGTASAVPSLQRRSSSSTWNSGPSVRLSVATTANANNAMTPDSHAPAQIYPLGGAMSDAMTVSRPGSASSSIIHPLVSGQQVPSVLPNVIPTIETTQPRNITSEPVSHPGSIASQPTDTRPTILAAYHDEHLSRMLPPKRELPFLKSSQENARVKKPRTDDVVSRHSESQPTHPNREPGHNTPDCAEGFVPDSQPSQPLTQTQIPPTASQQSLQSFQLQPIAYTGMHSTQPVPSQQLTHPTDSQFTVESSQDTGRNTHNGQMSQVLPRSATSVEEQLALYVSSPSAGRIAFLENWMCELLEDDKFVTLCQDVEATWRRFAFGMKR